MPTVLAICGPEPPGGFDAGVVRDRYRDRRAVHEGAAGTSFYVVELAGVVAAVFALTELPRVRPVAGRRLLLHDVRVAPRFRGLELADVVFGWLRTPVGAGREVELFALWPVERGDPPPVYRRFGLVESHRLYTWPAT